MINNYMSTGAGAGGGAMVSFRAPVPLLSRRGVSGGGGGGGGDSGPEAGVLLEGLEGEDGLSLKASLFFELFNT